MKLFVSMMILGLMQVHANVYSQTTDLSVSCHNMPVRDVLNQIEQVSGLYFFMNDNLPEMDELVSINVQNQSFDYIMNTVLRGLGLSYRMYEDNVVVITEEKIFQGITITGTVTDAEGSTLPGVNVSIKGTNQGTVTGANGIFSLLVPDENTILVFSYIGFVSNEITVGNQRTINVSLSEDTRQIEEVVVVGYGVQKKVNLTGAVGQVTSEVLQNRPITNVAQGLQGVIPNLNVSFSNGNPNTDPSFNIRGNTTINDGTPLILVDGIQMNVNLLNPADIESISVLKDASSAAIYGARGAFGVILVTTKSGKKERPPQVEFEGSIQWNTPTYLPDMISTIDFINARNESVYRQNFTYAYDEQRVQAVLAYQNDPLNNPNFLILPNGNIFWCGQEDDNYSQMLQKWAPIQKYTVSMNGGTKQTSYYVSAGYMNQQGVFKEATDILNRYNFLMNVTIDITDKLQLGARGSYTQRVYNEPHQYDGKGSSWWEQMTRGEPQILFPIKTPDNFPYGGGGIPTEHFYNYLTSGSRNISNTENALFTLQAGYDLFKGLKLKSDFSYRTTNYRRKDVRKEFWFIRDSPALQNTWTTPSFVRRDMSHTDYFAFNLYADYNLTLKDHHITALLGFNQEWSVFSEFHAQKDELMSNDVPAFGMATGAITMNDSEWDWAIRGVFMRFNYDYKGKYLFEMNGRYDGSSKFPKSSRFVFFPSFSVGWRISNEDFMSNMASTLSNLKIRASYGSLGNQNIAANYPYISTFSTNTNMGYIINNSRPLSISTPGLVSDSYTWETATTKNLGIDIGLWNKLTLDFDIYQRITKDMVTAGDKLPAVLGTGVPRYNNAELKTNGWELNVKWIDRIANQLRYDIGFVLSDYQATITKFDNNPNKLYADGANYVGRKIGEIWGYETVGIIQTPEEADAAPSHRQMGNSRLEPGDIQYKDLNNDGIIYFGDRTVDNPGDEKIIGNNTPRYMYGITANVQWKGFDCNIFFQGIGKRDFFPSGSYFWGARNNVMAVGTYETYLDAWREDNRNAYFPSYKASSGYNIQTQTRYLQSAAYIRLKNLTIGYSLPSYLVQKIRVNKVRIYGSGYNIWETSKLRGNFDPEIIGTVGEYYPLQRSFMTGIQIIL